MADTSTCLADGGVQAAQSNSTDVWGAALDVEDNARVKVTYNHGSGFTTVTGEVTGVDATYAREDEGGLVISFVRDDGQPMWLTATGEVHTSRARSTRVGTLHTLRVSTRNAVPLPSEMDALRLAKREARRQFEQHDDPTRSMAAAHDAGTAILERNGRAGGEDEAALMEFMGVLAEDL